MRTFLRYLLPVLLISAGGIGWFVSSRPPVPTEIQPQSQHFVSPTPSQPAQKNVAPSATRSGPLPATGRAPRQGTVHTAPPAPQEEAASRAKNTDSHQEQEPDDDETDVSLRANLAAIGFTAQDIERILQVVFAPSGHGLADADASQEQDEDIDAPGLDELADDLRARFTAAGFSPKDIERILEVVLAQPVDVFPDEEEDPEDVQEPGLDDFAEDFQDRLLAADFSPQDIANILQAVFAVPVEASSAAPNAPAELERADVSAYDLSPANLQARLLAAGFSPQEAARILQILLLPTGQ